MLYYKNGKLFRFFEKERYSINKIPTWDEIDFVFEDFNLKELENKIKDKNQTVPENIWKKLINVFKYQDNQKEIETLRDPAIKMQPKIKEYMDKKEILTFEEFEYKDGKTLLEETKNINVESYSSMYEYFKRGDHIGTCMNTSRLMGVIFKDPLFYKGYADFLTGTKNCSDGIHAWIETKINNKDYVVDTSMMLLIPTKLKEELGYRSPQKPYTVEDITSYGDNCDTFYTHYEEMTKYTTKDKFSYVSYDENYRKIKKEKDFEIEL